jgi:hypothetical protein
MISPRQRAVIAYTSSVALLLLCAAVVVPLRADTAWRAMEAETEALRAELEDRPVQREVLWGEPGPGNAHEHYAQAMSLARALRSEHEREIIPLLSESDADVSEHCAALRERWQPLLAALRDGARAADVSRPQPGPDEVPEVPNMLNGLWATYAAVLEVRALRHEGRGMEAVRLSLDMATFAADLAQGGTTIEQATARALLETATCGTWAEPALADLDRAALDELAQGLARLDAHLPLSPDGRGELLYAARHIQRMPTTDNWLPSSMDGWQFGFSGRWILADMLLMEVARVRRLEVTAGAPWPAREAALDGETERALASGNPLADTFVKSFTVIEAPWREQLARLRLLRLAVDLHRGVEPPPLVDPIGGGPIGIRETEAGIELRCAAITDPARTTWLVTR